MKKLNNDKKDGITLILLVVTIVAVSYTHLDVYKRQTMDWKL